MHNFAVTYDIVTPESAESGEVDESGFILRSGTLREAIKEFTGTRTSRVDGVECIEANDSSLQHARWFTIINGMEYETGAQESRSLHIPDSITRASRLRIARLLGVRRR